MSRGATVTSLAAADPAGRAVSFASANPLVVAAAVATVVVLVLLARDGVRYFWKPEGESLLSVLGESDRVAVLMHPNPDPDAMGSALAVATMADQVGTDAVIQYPGEIRHHQNRAFRTVLDLDLEHVGDVTELASDDVVLVDHNATRGFRGAEGVDPVAVVDHHPGDGTGTEFTDVRPEYGACASILAEYLSDLDADLVGPDESADAGGDDLVVPTDVVTGLMYGVLADTSHLTEGCTAAEFAAASRLYEAVDPDRLDRIANPRVDAETLEVKARAITEREVEPPYAVSDVGEVDNVDAIPQAASELVGLETVTAVVVVGDDGETIHLSGRSRDDRVHMGEVLEEVTADIPMASGGGHARMGGGQIDIQHMEGLGPGSGITRSDLRSQLFAAMTGKELATEGTSEE
jgi:nanoRNase/pAp phosphatase (c-di-AMP/oligoRNAs hydrolase)